MKNNVRMVSVIIITLIILIIILLIYIIVTISSSDFSISDKNNFIDCGTDINENAIGCFSQKLLDCFPAKIGGSNSEGIYEYNILNKKSNYCEILVKQTNKQMICQVPLNYINTLENRANGDNKNIYLSLSLAILSVYSGGEIRDSYTGEKINIICNFYNE